MKRPAAPLAPSGLALDVDLDAMFAAELPPCRCLLAQGVMTRGRCGQPSVAMARAKCPACAHSARFPVCGEHAEMLRSAAGHVTCLECGVQLDIGGLS